MPKTDRRGAVSREAPILKGCLQLLELRGFPHWRINSGMLRNPAGRPVRFGAVGMSDIVGLVPKTAARLIVVEAKRPGGRPTEAQRAFLESVRRCGGVALVADDLARFDAALARLQRDPSAVLTFDGLPADGPGEG